MKMIQKRRGQSLISRLIVNSLLLYLVVYLFSPEYLGTLNGSWDTIVSFGIASIIFSVLNAVIRPIIIILTLPMVVLSLGLFTLIINGIILYLTATLTPNLTFSIGNAIVGSIIIGVANFLITKIIWNGEK